MTPRVSIVVPTYNSDLYVDATIRSILDQEMSDFELIVSDHSSTDATWARVQQYRSDPRVRMMQIPSGGGAPANWAAVTEQARGELIKLVCGDDLLYPTILDEQIRAFDAYPDAVLVASQRDILDSSGEVLMRGRGLQGLHGKVDGAQAIRRTVRAGTNVFGEPACVMYRREALVRSGGWDDRSPYLIDQATSSRVLTLGPMVAVRKSLAGFRINPGQWSVHLAKIQAEHARQFHHRLKEENPGLLSDWDVRLGDVNATAMAVARRATYWWLDRKRPRPIRRGEQRPVS